MDDPLTSRHPLATKTTKLTNVHIKKPPKSLPTRTHTYGNFPFNYHFEKNTSSQHGNHQKLEELI